MVRDLLLRLKLKLLIKTCLVNQALIDLGNRKRRVIQIVNHYVHCLKPGVVRSIVGTYIFETEMLTFSWKSRDWESIPISLEQCSFCFACVADLLEGCFHELSFLLVDALLERALDVG
jgi:hypothetical protein